MVIHSHYTRVRDSPSLIYSDAMLVIPAIDLLNGSCVRLYQGDYEKAQSYDSDPVSVAKRFEAAGAERIHIVDLDAARGKGSDNRQVIRRIASSVDAVVEVGGGVRTERDVEMLIEAGVDFLIVGTLLVQDPKRAEGWIKRYGDKFLAGIDARDGRVSISGWERDSSVKDIDLAKKVADAGFAGIVYTNIAVDGTMSGPDLERTNTVAEATRIDIVLSGGISGLSDVERVLRDGHPGIIGIITGKAIYEGSLDLKTAFELVADSGSRSRGTK